MEPVFISVGVMVGALLLIAYYVQNGAGGMSQPLQTLGRFLLVKAPAGAVDPRRQRWPWWSHLGPFRPCVAGSRGDPRFRGPLARLGRHRARLLASLGWSYDDGSGLATTISMTLRTGLVMVFIGTTLTATARTSGGRLQRSQRLDDGPGLHRRVPARAPPADLGRPVGMDAATEDLLSKVVSSVVLHTVVGGALLVNVLITLANRGDAPIAYTSWFLVNALVVMLVAPPLYIGGELEAGPRPCGWPKASKAGCRFLMLGTAYAVIPAASERAIWSSSLATASSPCSSSPCPRCRCARWTPSSSWRTWWHPDDLQHAPAAGGLGQPASDRSLRRGSASSPAGLAGVLAMFLLPIYAVGAYFSGMETLVGEASLHGLNMALSHGLFFTVGGLLALSATLGYLPQANGRAAADTGGASTAVWMVALGGFLATVSTALSTLATRAVERGVSDEDMVEAALANMAGFDLVGAFLFYGVALGFMVAASVSVRIGFSPLRPAPRSAATSAPTPFPEAEHRSLLGRGVGLDTELIIGGDGKAAAGSTVIAVRADLHNDEVTEFPEDAAAVPEELQMLADYLDETKQDVFSFFRSIDLDDSGSIDARELQNALRGAKIANLPPWDMGRLISAIDIDGDGHINLPESTSPWPVCALLPRGRTRGPPCASGWSASPTSANPRSQRPRRPKWTSRTTPSAPLTRTWGWPSSRTLAVPVP